MFQGKLAKDGRFLKMKFFSFISIDKIIFICDIEPVDGAEDYCGSNFFSGFLVVVAVE